MLEKNSQLYKQVDQWITVCKKNHQHTVTNFFTPEDLQQVTNYLNNKINYVIDGGINNYERAKILLNVEDNNFTDVVVLYTEINLKYDKLEHKDVLGTLMGLGIQREILGDVIIDDDKIFVVTNQMIGKFLIDNCLKIKQTKVKFSIYENNYTRVYNYEKLHVNVSSLRYDAVIASLVGTSRDKAKQLINNKMVVINHQTLEDIKKLCHNNDIISIRKVGKYVYKDVEKVTKKQRLIIEIWKYI